jgi:hypothetical protein
MLLSILHTSVTSWIINYNKLTVQMFKNSGK